MAKEGAATAEAVEAEAAIAQVAVVVTVPEAAVEAEAAIAQVAVVVVTIVVEAAAVGAQALAVLALATAMSPGAKSVPSALIKCSTSTIRMSPACASIFQSVPRSSRVARPAPAPATNAP